VPTVPPLADTAAVVARLRASTGAYDHEPVDILGHCLQCAAALAASHPDDEQLQVAGLVHDLGWLATDTHGVEVVLDARHDRVGAALVRDALGPRVARLVGGHVEAKRYLVAAEPGYAATLSPRSVATLSFQGGPSDAAEGARFDRDPDRDALLALRRADDAAKDPDAVVPGLDVWIRVIERVAAAARA